MFNLQSYKAIRVAIAFFLLIASNLHAQEFRYEVSSLGIKAGEVQVSRKVNGNVEQYHISSNSSVDYLFGKITVVNTTSTTFKDGVMQSCFLRTDKNGEVDKYCSANYDGKTYQVQTESKKFTINQPVTFSITKMYFKEPIGVTEIFSEVWGELVPVTKTKPNQYSLKQPDGKYHRYTYENGVIVEVEVPSPIGKAHIRLKK